MKNERARADASQEAEAPDVIRRLRSAPLLGTVMRSALWRNLALTVLWVLMWQLGRLVEYTEHASVWFPVAGLTFAVLLLDGMRSAPGLLAGCVLVTIWVGEHYGVPLSRPELAGAGLLWAGAHVGTYGIGARLLRSIARRGDGALPSLLIGFMLIAALSSLIAMALGI
ncbi:MAG TPA: hypothetical protein VGC21_16545, partial [Telluria sp.]